MKLWEVILYAITGGIAELLPISFGGHVLMFRNAFRSFSLWEGEGLYIRACICLGVVIAIYLVYHRQSRDHGITLRGLGRRSPRRPIPGEQRLKFRVNLLGIFAFVPMLVSFAVLSKVEMRVSLTFAAFAFLINTILIYACGGGHEGQREDREVTLVDALLIGLFRMLAIVPGLSSVGASLCIGRARGFSNRFNLRFTYLITLIYELTAFFYFLFLAMLRGSFAISTLLPCVVTVMLSAVAGYFTLLYFRHLFMKNHLRFFLYYCIDAAAIAFIISILNG